MRLKYMYQQDFMLQLKNNTPCVLPRGEANTRAARDLMLAGRLGEERFFCRADRRDWFLASKFKWLERETGASTPKHKVHKAVHYSSSREVIQHIPFATVADCLLEPPLDC